MAAEQKRRKVVFQEKDSAPPVEVEPPFQPAQDESDEIPAVDDFEEGSDAEAVMPAVEEKLVVGAKEESSSGLLINGWRVIGLEQQDTHTYLVTADLNSEGVRAFWRKTRVLSHNKWTLYGKWTDIMTRADVLPIPLYYKEVV